MHHVLARVFKDLFPRYKTMRGYRVPRKGGWDTHGLPVELEVERELGLKSKPEIEEFGVEEFNRRCRESVFRYVQEWERADRPHRLLGGHGRPPTSPTTTTTSSPSGGSSSSSGSTSLLYLDYRSTPHCPRCGTSLSDARGGARATRKTRPTRACIVKFRLTLNPQRKLSATHCTEPRRRAQYSLVAWTTTPWTLPGNTALAVNPDAEYGSADLDERVPHRRRRALAEEVLGRGRERVATAQGTATSSA